MEQGNRVLVEATINETPIRNGQPLIGIRIIGAGRVFQLSVPRECIQEVKE